MTGKKTEVKVTNNLFIYVKIFAAVFFCNFGFCSENRAPQDLKSTHTTPGSIQKIQPVILGTIPHDSTAFTQGLFYRDGVLYESDGLYGKSDIRKIDTTGTVIQNQAVPDVFAEGCALMGSRLFQITWREQTVIIYSLPSLKPEGTLAYDGEGWGLTSDSNVFIMSNGSDTLYFRDTEFKITGKLAVTLDSKPLVNLNELEFARGNVFANVWFSDYIFEISPQNGKVLRIIDCANIVRMEKPDSEQNVLNGIAFVPQGNYFYVTGKNWSNYYKIAIPPLNN
jgi:glutamine cyclotransferase